ncbi:response regulator receiver protein [Amycolatopsis sp. 195334CR]|uniref:response regulator receiver protein n=1 Tax=Amycolatopsis sp. 195334CR TaxID=2814588 RepID=UPI001A8EAA27|nr:response regulator receiver protein [Amycolatopsis sp. 195334CR]MBN6040064.1 response regulator receiver protein [Amycolatopsis sp. 195334CR]
MTENAGSTAEDRGPEQARCGFRRCRQPLPPPGPRGGRPYEFCPDRTWPGGKTCKQLAAAEQALREALGEDAVPAAALSDAGEAFSTAAAAVTGPLRTLSDTLDAVTAHLQDEVAVAVDQAEAARQAAAQAAQERDIALERAAEASQAAEAAAATVREAEQAQAVAEATADEAIEARSAAQLAQAKAESATAVITKRAEEATEQAAAQQARVDELTATLSSRGEELATRTAERDAARIALRDAQEQSKTWERLLETQKNDLTAELEAVQKQLRKQEASYHDFRTKHETHQTESRTHLAASQAELSATRGQLDTTQLQLAQSQAQHDQVTRLLSRVRQRALAATAEPPTPLRDDLLSILLTDDTPTTDTDPGAAHN